MGNTPMSRDLLFDIPEDYARKLVKTKKEGSSYKIVEGIVKGRSQSIWFTNLDHAKRHEEMILYRKYTQEDYLHYDNYDAINVDKTKEIPQDWGGVMGVPITFLDKYNPEQFEIIDLNPHFFMIRKQGLTKPRQLKIAGRKNDPYARILIRNKRPKL